jgi:xylulokinase
MTRLMGIDLGTSSVKVVISDERARLLGSGMHEYPIHTPQPGWAEQDPEDWWHAVIIATRQALAEAGADSIAAISFSGQMHGGVLLDSDQQPLAPAIIWPDQRSAPQVETILATLGAETLAYTAGTAPAAGFMASTLCWLKQHDPARLEKARAMLLPKDYIRLRLAGEVATDASDASGTALFDIRTRRWWQQGIAALGLPDLWPPVLNSSDIAGHLLATAAAELGLMPGIPVAAGCADQVAQAIGNGLVDPGVGSVTIGTGGQLFAPLAQPQTDPQLRLHTFCHGPADRWYLLGATLSAGLSLRWFRDLLGLTDVPDAYDQLAALAMAVPPGADGLIFLPYLVGERSPLMDPLARGTFVGLTLRHGRGHLVRAIMEGVAFALRQTLEVMRAVGAPMDRLIASGNGLASPTWRQIASDVLGCPLTLSMGGARAGIGAALVAGLGAGVYRHYDDLARVIPAQSDQTDPDPARMRVYDEQYARFVQLYPLLKPVMHALKEPHS